LAPAPLNEDRGSPYEMSISLNVLQHLGLNLYSNVPAVLSEVVANSYDADASRVNVDIDVDDGVVVISDDGHGMTLEQINARFLNVGFTRRTNGLATSPNGRKVMGRKGIGKLSLFSIADVVEVHTARAGERNSLRMSTEGIRSQLKKNGSEPYRPSPISTDAIDFEHGTRIVLRSLKKRLSRTSDALRTRLARRFSVLGDDAGFHLFVGGSEVTVTDRDYFHKLEFLWTFGSGAATVDVAGRAGDARVFQGDAVLLVPVDEEGTPVIGGEPFEVTGWIGTAKSTSALKDQRTGDNINKISLVLRGKLAHEDLMEEFNENGMYASYLIGEIHADFLDDDEEDDIATSSRQRIVEDDPRYRALVAWLKKTTTVIGRAWLAERDQGGRDRALHNELIAEWFKSLQRDQRKKAERLFGKINQLTVNREEERNALFAQAVIGFETLRYRDNLDAIDQFEPEDLRRLSVLFGDIADIQAALYRKIVRQRLEVIEKLREHVDANDLERVLQEHLYKNLWLLDPAWERAADHSMEERVSTAFKAIDAQLTPEEAASRIDIRYKRTGGTNVIVELKRASVHTDALTLLQQIDKYQNALRKYLRDTQRPELIEVVCVLGRYPQAWTDREVHNQEVKMLAAKGARVVLYETLLADAQSSYREYLQADTEAGRIATLIEGLASHADDDELVSGEVSDIAPAGVL
jgi:hypothetical protein